MLNPDELREIASDLESDRVERKSSATDRDRICEAICAFANDLPEHRLPGCVLIGVDDGVPTRMAVTDELLRTLADMRENGRIYPFPSMTVTRGQLDDHDVVVIEVQPSTYPPVKFRGRTWIRVGPRRAVATPEEEARLVERRRLGTLPFDARPIDGATIGDLDLSIFREEYLSVAVAPEVLAENARSVGLQLASLRLASPDGIPTVAGVLLLSPDPTSFVAGAAIEFLRFDGEGLDAPVLDHKRVAGPLSQVIRMTEELFEVNVTVTSDFLGSPVESKGVDYPTDALRQLVRNAVLHRAYEGTNAPVRVNWFADRVEILSPGGPYGQVTVENFGTPGITDYRNPTLAEIMSNLGYVQRFGAGLPTARRALEANGNPELELEAQPTAVLATVRRAT